MGLPVPPSLRPPSQDKGSALERARVPDGALPVGGAPPMKLPPINIDRQPARVPASHAEQLPQKEGRPVEQIKADFLKAVELMNQAGGSEDKPKEDKPADVEESEDQDENNRLLGDLTEFNWEGYDAKLAEDSDFRRGRVRRKIEERCSPIEVSDLIMYESVEQRQIIIPDKLEVVFRSITSQEDMAIKEYLWKVKIGSDRYILDMITLLTLTCGLKTFNDVSLPDHFIIRNDERVVDHEKLEAKLHHVMKLGLQIVSLLSVAYFWFDQRVRKELVAGVLGKS